MTLGLPTKWTDPPTLVRSDSRSSEPKAEVARELGCEVVIYQTNHEGDLLDFLHREAPGSTGVVLNPASFTYQSYALFDCLNALAVPVVEVHISNLYSREERWRVNSITAAAARGVIMGLGFHGYLAAMEYLCDRDQ